MRNLSKNTLKRFISARTNTNTIFLNTETRNETNRLYFQYGIKIEKSKGYERMGSIGNIGKRFGAYTALTLRPYQVPKSARKLINFHQDYEKQ
jgi:hypothetical protein